MSAKPPVGALELMRGIANVLDGKGSDIVIPALIAVVSDTLRQSDDPNRDLLEFVAQVVTHPLFSQDATEIAGSELNMKALDEALSKGAAVHVEPELPDGVRMLRIDVKPVGEQNHLANGPVSLELTATAQDGEVTRCYTTVTPHPTDDPTSDVQFRLHIELTPDPECPPTDGTMQLMRKALISRAREIADQDGLTVEEMQLQ